MLTIEALQAMGVKTQEGLARCLNNEAFYFRMIKLAAEDANFEKLRTALEAGDLDAAFEAALALKGVTGNLALTPIYEPVQVVTELLRSRTETDYSADLTQIEAALADLRALCAD